MSSIFRLGLIVNPYAGIGGALALKGSDGLAIREQALANGAQKQATGKAVKAMSKIASEASKVVVFTAAGEMGEQLAVGLDFDTHVVYTPKATQTEAEDTQGLAQALLASQVDLILFAGGDGTARNLFDVVGEQVPVMGIPAGCKIHSGVFAVTPSSAGEVVRQMVRGEIVSELVGEVRDIDEDAFRQGEVHAKYYGEMRIPHALMYVQSVKMGGKESDELVLDDMIASMQEEMDSHPDSYFIMGSGSTVDALMHACGIDNTLLGVDVVFQGKRVLQDATAAQLEGLVDDHPGKVKAVITLIGGQGHLFGRGNQQISAKVIRALGKANFYVLASKTKLETLCGRPVCVDTGDDELDKQLQGPLTIVTGYRDKVLYPIG